MKILYVTFLLLCALLTNSQRAIAQTSINEAVKEISTIGILDTNKTKSGYRINKYFIELNDSLFKAYKGKRIEVTGKLLIVKAIDPSAKEMEQGSLNDRFFIVEPQITIIYDSREPLKAN